MDTCADALAYYFDAMVVLTVVGAAFGVLNCLLFVILYYMSKSHEAFKVEARAALKETGYLDE